MSVNVYLSGNEVHDRVLRAFAEGVKDRVSFRDVQDYEPSDVAVVFGVQKKAVPFSEHRGKVIREQKFRGAPVVVLETGYIERGDGPDNYYAAGLNGLNGRADFKNQGMGPERWRWELKPWSSGEEILLCGQVPWDASCEFEDIPHWLRTMAQIIRMHTDRPITFRPHPLCRLGPVPGCRYSSGTLEEDLARAHAVITFNSNTAVDALLAGKPVFAGDIGSMAWTIAKRNIDGIDDWVCPDRTQWARDLSYAQWTLEEMRRGLAWLHLFGIRIFPETR